MAKHTQAFNAEINQLLQLMIHSLYSHKEIFLRELISNAADALDKLKFQAITQENLVPAGHEYFIQLAADKNLHTLKIIDSGIGMTKEDVVQFIGTIARSGTKAFIQASEEIKNRPELIGQFGVGFYSSFMVADKVTLHTQKAGETMGVLWESVGDGTYTIDDVPRPEGTGTTITLHLKSAEKDVTATQTEKAGSSDGSSEETSQDFTDPWTLKSLVKKYSDFISHPIKMNSEEGKEEILNCQKALWLKSPNEVTAEEYKEFYKQLSYDWNDPAKTLHYKAEGTLEFNALLFLPSKKPFNYFNKDMEYGLSLYVKRVFIMADCKDLLPTYLRFVKGIVDSSDLSLNVSREILQQNRQVSQIRKNVINKVLNGLKELLTKERSNYENYWVEFGATLKEGLPQDPTNKEKLQDLLLFQTSHSTSESISSSVTSSDANKTGINSWTTLDEYVSRMPTEQKDIYFITGDTLEQLKQSPYLERLKEKKFEVLYLTDAVDEWVVDSFQDFKGKKMVSVMKSSLDLDTDEEKKSKEAEKKEYSERYKTLIENLKSVLSENVKDVVLSDRLTQSPVCLVASDNDPSARLERILSNVNTGYNKKSKRVLELNPKHPVIEKMLLLDDRKRSLWAEVLYGQALLNEGSPLSDPSKFSIQLTEVMIGS